MSFSINSITTNASDEVVSLSWTYDNGSGSVSGKHVLNTPAGAIALTTLTETDVLGWLTDQIRNTTAEFDAQITANVARAAEVAGYVEIETPESGPYIV